MKHSGQAMMELVAGMFVLALLVSAACTFAVYIAKSLEAQNELRRAGGTSTKYEHVQTDQFAAEQIFGVSSLQIKERVVMPTLEILR